MRREDGDDLAEIRSDQGFSDRLASSRLRKYGHQRRARKRQRQCQDARIGSSECQLAREVTSTSRFHVRAARTSQSSSSSSSARACLARRRRSSSGSSHQYGPRSPSPCFARSTRRRAADVASGSPCARRTPDRPRPRWDVSAAARSAGSVGSVRRHRRPLTTSQRSSETASSAIDSPFGRVLVVLDGRDIVGRDPERLLHRRSASGEQGHADRGQDRRHTPLSSHVRRSYRPPRR